MGWRGKGDWLKPGTSGARPTLPIAPPENSVTPLDSIFRTFLTIKGTCGFFDFPRLEAIAHAAEGLFSEATGLDKTILEAIKDPLTHLIRKAIDHGIEPPEARLAAGKPAEGAIHLRAYHERGMVNIEIQDDGAGISPPHRSASRPGIAA